MKVTKEGQSQLTKSLVQLASEINSEHEVAMVEAKQAQGHTYAAIVSALNCGRLLMEARDHPDNIGKWILWLGNNCPKICRMTANKYIRLLERVNHGLHITENMSLRQAYIAAEIINEPKKKSRIVDEFEAYKERQHQLPVSVDPLDGKESIVIDFYSGETDVACESSNEDDESRGKILDALRSLAEWLRDGNILVCGEKVKAFCWVIGMYDTDKGTPSLRKVAEHEGCDITSISRYSAAFTEQFGIRNRAQAHGDGVRKG